MKKIKIALGLSAFVLVFLGLQISKSDETNSVFSFSLESKAYANMPDPTYDACPGDFVALSFPEFGTITCGYGGSGGTIPHLVDIPYEVCYDAPQSCCPMTGFDPVPTC